MTDRHLGLHPASSSKHMYGRKMLCLQGTWSLDEGETGKITKSPWVGVMEGTTGKNGRISGFKGRGRILAPPLIKIN